jgi:hypothetical protein
VHLKQQLMSFSPFEEVEASVSKKSVEEID